MKKAIIKAMSVMLAVVLTLTAAPLSGFIGLELPALFDFRAEAATASGNCGTNAKWALDSSGVLTISGSGAMTDYSAATYVPWYDYKNQITGVTISSGISKIGNYCFYGLSRISSITIPGQVTSIGGYAFSGCSSLTYVYIPTSVSTIYAGAFNGCSNLSYVYYYGSSSQWENITINSMNTSLTNAYFIYNYGSTINGILVYSLPTKTSYLLGDTIDTSGLVILVKYADGTTKKLSSGFECQPSVVNTYGTQKITVWYQNIYSDSFNVNVSVSKEFGNNLKWTLDIEGNLKIFGTGEMPDYTSSTPAPWNQYAESVKTVTITNGVTNIGEYAFYNCVNLTDVSISDSVTTIGDGAFYRCSSIKNIIIPDSVTTMGNDVFDSCSSLTNIIFSDNSQIEIIGKDAFYNCHSLTGITIPKGVTTIGKYAFYNCSNLTSVTIPDSVSNIDEYAFHSCESIKTVYYIGNKVQWEKIIIGNNNTSILDAKIIFDAFSEYENYDSGVCGDGVLWYLMPNYELLITGTGAMTDYPAISYVPWYKYRNEITSISISSSITKIGNYSFYGLSGISSVTIPGQVTSIGEYAFSGGSNIEDVHYTGDILGWCAIAFNAPYGNPMYYAKKLYIDGELIEGELVIPNGVTSIGNDTFRNCVAITSVKIPDSVTNIDRYAFENCIGITNYIVAEDNMSYSSDNHGVLFNKNKTQIIRYPVGNTRTLYEVPDSVTTLGIYAFYNCNKLTSVKIPDSVINIGSYAFKNCINIKGIVIPNSVTEIGEEAFSGCSALENVTIGEKVTEIDKGTFYGCKNLKSITIPDSVTEIGEEAFFGCQSLKSITISDSVTSIGNDAFAYCSALENVYYIGSISSWCSINFNGNDSNPMYYSDNLYIDNKLIEGELVIPVEVTEIGRFAFYNLTDITSVTILDSVTEIGEDAFSGCSALENVYYTGNILGWCSINFNNRDSNPMDCADNLYIDNKLIEGELVIPDEVTEIGRLAFYNCADITSVTIPDSVTAIGSGAFTDCNALRTVYYIGSETQWKNILNNDCFSSLIKIIYNAFSEDANYGSGTCGENLKWILYADGDLVISGMGAIPDYSYNVDTPWYHHKDKIKKVTLIDGVTSIGSYAFRDCSFIKSVAIPASITRIGEEAFGNSSKIEHAVYYGKVEQWKTVEVNYGNNYILKALEFIADNGRPYCDKGTCGDNLSWILYGDGELEISGNGDMMDYSYTETAPWSPNNGKISKVTILDGVTSLGNYAFSGCTGIKELTMPVSVKIYNSTAVFNSCTNINKITLTKGTGTMQSFSSKTSGELTYYAYTPWYKSRDALKELAIEDGVTCIGTYAFYNCTGITNITIPDSTTLIGDYAFAYCTNLASVIISNSETSIATRAFGNCSGLKSVTIPVSVNLFTNSFYGCNNIKSVTLTKGTGVMSNFGKDFIKPWSGDSCETVVIEDGVTNISKEAFCYCRGLVNITIPDSVNSIGASAFYGCVNLTSITIPKGVTKIPESTFLNCASLTQVTIPDNITNIGDNAFSDCYGLTDVTMGKNIKYIGNYAFRSCSSLTSVIIPDNVVNIGSLSFDSCKKLAHITIGNGVRSIGEKAFYDCDALETVCYNGTEEMFNKITLGYYNYDLEGATKYYHAETESIRNTVGAYDATETKHGYTGDVCCEICKILISQGEVIHNYVVREDKATCTQGGSAHYQCSVCEDNYTEQFDAIGHNYEIVITQPTCTTEGYTTYICSVCQDSYIDDEIPANGHEYYDVVTNPTCILDGFTTHTCFVCGDRYTDREIEAKGHKYNSVVTEPTCTENGFTTYTCSVCGDSYTQDVPKLEHTIGSWVITSNVSCTENGEKIAKCTVCGEIAKTETIPAPGHTEGEWEVVLEPTYEADGKKVQKCTACGEVIAEKVIPMFVKAVVTDKETGVSLEYNKNAYSGVVDIVIEESNDEKAFEIIDTKLNASQRFVYDITMMVDGIETQPNGKITIRMPLPNGYDPNRSFVYYVNTNEETAEKIPAKYENGYMVFETDHFSYYVIIEEYNYTFNIQTPSMTTIRHKDGIKLHAKVEGTAPKGYYIEWTASNGNFKTEEINGGDSFKIISDKNGYTTFTATLYNKDGEILAEEIIEMNSKAGFFDKIGSFFRSLFGGTKIHEN